MTSVGAVQAFGDSSEATADMCLVWFVLTIVDGNRYLERVVCAGIAVIINTSLHYHHSF